MHAHERIDPRRGPGRERDSGRRAIDAGVAEYEEDRDARESSLYDSCDDWGFDDFYDDDWTDNEMDHLEDSLMTDARDEAYQAHELDDAHISARVENNRIVIEVPLPANTTADDWAKIVADLTRRIAIEPLAGRTPHGHPIRDAAEMEQAECPYPPDSDIQNDSASTMLETSTTKLEDTGTILRLPD